MFVDCSPLKLRYYQEKVNVGVASPVAKQFKTFGFRKFGKFKKISEVLEYSANHPKYKFWHLSYNHSQNI